MTRRRVRKALACAVVAILVALVAFNVHVCEQQDGSRSVAYCVLIDHGLLD